MSRNVQEKYLGTMPCHIHIYRALQFIVFLRLATQTRHQIELRPTLRKKCMKIDVFCLRVICTCEQCDSPLCALQLTALIKPNWCVLLYCVAWLYHSLIVMKSTWTTIPCPTTKLSLLISKSFVAIKQSVINVALKTPLKTRLGICIYIISLPHRPDNYIGFTSSCPPHIL